MRLATLTALLPIIGLCWGQKRKELACLPGFGWSESMCKQEDVRARKTYNNCLESHTFAINCCLYCYKKGVVPTRECRNADGYTTSACNSLNKLITRSAERQKPVLYYLAMDKCFGTLYCVPEAPYPYTLKERAEIKYMETLPSFMKNRTSTTVAPNSLVKEEKVTPTPVTTKAPTTTTTTTTTTTQRPETKAPVKPEEMPAPPDVFPGPTVAKPSSIWPSTKQGILSKFLPGSGWFPIRFGRRGNPNQNIQNANRHG